MRHFDGAIAGGGVAVEGEQPGGAKQIEYTSPASRSTPPASVTPIA